MIEKHTDGPWFSDGVSIWRRDPRELYENGGGVAGDKSLATFHRGFHHEGAQGYPVEANSRLSAAAPDLLAALIEARRAIGEHFAPNECYATGPMTGNEYRDLVECPACSAIGMFDAAIAKATGEQP